MAVDRNNIRIVANTTGIQHEFTSSNLVENSVKLDKYCMKGETLQYGTAVSTAFEFAYFETQKIDWSTVRYVDYYSGDVLLYRGFVEETKKNDDSRWVTCLDPFASLDEEYSDTINSYVFTSFEMPADQVLERFLTYTMGELNSPPWKIKKNYTASYIPTLKVLTGEALETATKRTVLEWILETIGIVAFTQGDTIILKSPKDYMGNIFDSTNVYDPLVLSEHTMDLTGVSFMKEVLEVTETEEGQEPKEEYKLKEILSGKTLRSYNVDDNPFIHENANQQWTDSIFNRDKSITWTPGNFAVEWEQGVELELLDIIEVIDRENTLHQFIITSLNYTHGDRVNLESIGSNWKKESYTVGGQGTRYAKGEAKIFARNIDATLAKVEEKHLDFVENYQKEKQDLIDHILNTEGGLEEVKKLVAEAEAKSQQVQEEMLAKQEEVDKAIADFEEKLTNIFENNPEFRQEIINEALKELDDKLKDIDIPQDKIDQALIDAGFDKTTIDDLRQKASQTSETLEMVAEIVGSDGRTTYNKNRATVTEGELPLGVEYLEVGHNGDGFEVGKTYTISWLAECIANPSSAITYKVNTFNGVKVALELKANSPYYPTVNEELTDTKTVYGIFNDTYTLSASSDWHKEYKTTQVVSGDGEYILDLEFKEIADGNLEHKYIGEWGETPTVILEGGSL